MSDERILFKDSNISSHFLLLRSGSKKVQVEPVATDVESKTSLNRDDVSMSSETKQTFENGGFENDVDEEQKSQL